MISPTQLADLDDHLYHWIIGVSVFLGTTVAHKMLDYLGVDLTDQAWRWVTRKLRRRTHRWKSRRLSSPPDS